MPTYMKTLEERSQSLILKEHKISEALKITEKEKMKRDAENAKLKIRIKELKSKNIEFRDKLTKVE
uniref:Uncharacterized protein n=1 Tax=Rhizophagus irregularis (strain DAOM 181602 / DAOM 197198 / MUCL 43194) TaxID=747089 RepID=U9TZ19_RHIID